MSTYYSDLKEPWSSIRVEVVGPHTKVTLWTEGQNVGTLTLGKEDMSVVLKQLFSENDVCHTSAIGGGKHELVRLRQHRSSQLLSEYGDIVEFNELQSDPTRARTRWLQEDA